MDAVPGIVMLGAVLLLSVLPYIALMRIWDHSAKTSAHLSKLEKLVELHVRETAALRSSQGFRPGVSE